MKRWVIHADGDFFYANCEMFRHPELRNVPLAIVGDPLKRHGIVLTANPMAKKCGVKTGQAIWQARQCCPKLMLLPPNFAEYEEVSYEAEQIFSEYSDEISGMGMDERWIDITDSIGVFGDPVKLAKEIQLRLWRELGITYSICVSFNKTISKLGSDMRKPYGFTYIPREQYKEIVYPLPVSDLLMVGPEYREKLRKRFVKTIGDLAAVPPEKLRYWFGLYGEMLGMFARGEENDPVAKLGASHKDKSIGNSHTLPRDALCMDDIKPVFMRIADNVAFRMREKGFKGRVISMSACTSEFTWFSRQRKIDKFTNLAKEIGDVAIDLFQRNFYWKSTIRGIGVSVRDFEHENDVKPQMDIFNHEAKRVKQENLERAVDELRMRYGVFSVDYASTFRHPLAQFTCSDNTHTPISFYN